MNDSPRFKLNKNDLPAIGKAWLTGAGLAVLVFTGNFILTDIDLGVLAPVAVSFVPMAIKAVQRWWTDYTAK